MKRRSFGPHATVSAVGFGCMSFAGFYGPADEARVPPGAGSRAGTRGRLLGHGERLWRRPQRDADRQVFGAGPQPSREGHARDQVRHPLDGRRAARARQQRRPHARGAGRLAEAARRRPRRSLLRAPGRRAHPDRGHRRRTRPSGRSRNDRRDRALRSRPRHAAARPRRSPDRRGSVGIFALDPHARTRAHSGLRRGGRAAGRLLAGRARRFSAGGCRTSKPSRPRTSATPTRASGG